MRTYVSCGNGQHPARPRVVDHPTEGWRRSTSVRTVTALAAVTVLLGAVALAQGQTVRVVGQVQWISAEKMMVIPDNGGLPIDVDITQVPQAQYETLTAGSPVIVVGVVSPDGRKLIASSIQSGG